MLKTIKRKQKKNNTATNFVCVIDLQLFAVREALNLVEAPALEIKKTIR